MALSGVSHENNQSASGANEVQHHHSHDLGHKKGPTTMFSGMQEYKRDSTASEQRRESLKDMSTQPQGGMVSNLFNKVVKGDDSAK